MKRKYVKIKITIYDLLHDNVLTGSGNGSYSADDLSDNCLQDKFSGWWKS